jgi:type II secretory pathway pseudopilin PulG
MTSNKQFIFSNKTKRAFLLIEILIALSIIALLIVPLIKNPIYFFKSQIKSLERLECERVADLTFLDLKIALYKGVIDVNNLTTNKKDSSYINLIPAKLISFNDKLIDRRYKIYSKSPEKKTEKDIYKFLTIRLFLRPIDQKEKYEYEYKTLYKKKLK